MAAADLEKVQVNPALDIKPVVDGRMVNYQVYYYQDSQSTKVFPVDDNGEILLGAEPIYVDGVWQKSQVSKGGLIDTPFYLSEKEQLAIHSNIQTATRAHSAAADKDVPQWARKERQDIYPQDNQTVRDPDTLELNKAGGVNWQGPVMYSATSALAFAVNPVAGMTYATLASPAGSVVADTLWNGPQGQLNKIGNSMGNLQDELFRRVVKYPEDLSPRQDCFFIQAYEYKPPYADAMGRQANDGAAVGLSRSSPFKRKLGAGIKLPMPRNLPDQLSTNWQEDSVSTQAISAVQSSNKHYGSSQIANFLGLGGLANSLRSLSTFGSSVRREAGRADFLANQLSQMAGDMGQDISAEQILARSEGVVANANTELMFSGVKLRSFDFSWVLSPRSESEAHNVRMIIRALKQWSAPRKAAKLSSGHQVGDGGVGQAGSASYFLGTPNIFRIRYVTAGNKNILGLNKFKPCALTNIILDYAGAGQGWQSYEGGMPVSITMTLKFNELEPIYNTDYSPNVADGRRFDWNDPTSLGDLMPISLIRQDDPTSSDVGY